VSKTVYLDTGVLGYITHPRGSEETTECVKWLLSLLKSGIRVCLPEICDYELRREYVLNGRTKALDKLNQLKGTIEYVPIQSPMMTKAADLWAFARSQGKPTADPKELDGDVILAAQAIISAAGSKIEIATTNVGHLSLFAQANVWRDVECVNQA
jgi:predicted nucleic acid-binding protein